MEKSQSVDNLKSHPILASLQNAGMVAGVVGLAALAGGLTQGQEQFFQSYLLGYVYALIFTVGCIGLMLLHHIVRGQWGFAGIRIFEAGAKNVGAMAVLFIPLIMGLSHLYPWAQDEAVKADHILQLKSAYLNTGFFVARAIVYFGLWFLLVSVLSILSKRQDQTGDLNLAQRRMNIAAPGFAFFILTVTFCFTDLVMSLEKHWFSTIYGLLSTVGGGLSALAMTIGLLLLLAPSRPFSELMTGSRWRDFGNLLLTLTILWAYMSFSQLLIIWSGNMGEEISYYVSRMQTGWVYVGVVLIFFHFLAPFLSLLSSRTKRTARLLGLTVILILLMRTVDVFWVVVPSFHRTGPQFVWTDAAAIFGFGGLWLWMFASRLRKQPPLPLNEPRLQEALQHG